MGAKREQSLGLPDDYDYAFWTLASELLGSVLWGGADGVGGERDTATLIEVQGTGGEDALPDERSGGGKQITDKLDVGFIGAEEEATVLFAEGAFGIGGGWGLVLGLVGFAVEVDRAVFDEEGAGNQGLVAGVAVVEEFVTGRALDDEAHVGHADAEAAILADAEIAHGAGLGADDRDAGIAGGSGLGSVGGGRFGGLREKCDEAEEREQ